MSAPADLKYLQTHEWHRIQGDTATIGITQFAADELTDITFVSLPKVGATLDANGRFGEVESVRRPATCTAASAAPSPRSTRRWSATRRS